MTLIRIGRLGRAHGLRGELALDGASLSPSELLGIRQFTWRGRGGATQELALEGARPAGQRLLVRFAGVNDRGQAARLTTGELLAERARIPDPGPGEAYTFQLVGLRVEEEGGRELGVVEDVLRTAAHPIFVVRGRAELLVPVTPGVVRSVDLAAGRITVVLPRGLEDL